MSKINNDHYIKNSEQFNHPKIFCSLFFYSTLNSWISPSTFNVSFNTIYIYDFLNAASVLAYICLSWNFSISIVSKSTSVIACIHYLTLL